LERFSQFAEIEFKTENNLKVINVCVYMQSAELRITARVTNSTVVPRCDLAGNLINLPSEDPPLSGIIDSEVGIGRQSTAEWIWPPSVDASLEDPRVFFCKEKKYYICTRLHIDVNHRYSTSIVLLDSSSDVVYPLTISSPRRFEKNWIPIDGHSEKLVILYRSRPFTLLSFDMDSLNKATIMETEEQGHHHDYNGGTKLVELPDGNFLRIARLRFRLWKVGLIHLNYALLYDSNLKLLSESSPFIFRGLGFETCNGAWIEGSNLYLSWTEDDENSFLGKVSISDVLEFHFGKRRKLGLRSVIRRLSAIFHLLRGQKLHKHADLVACVKVPRAFETKQE